MLSRFFLNVSVCDRAHTFGQFMFEIVIQSSRKQENCEKEEYTEKMKESGRILGIKRIKKREKKTECEKERDSVRQKNLKIFKTVMCVSQ